MTYYYFKDSKGEWRPHLKASNGRIIANSRKRRFDRKIARAISSALRE
jgi:uncharacterized protein YegP (UPF0339 family)